MPTTPRPSSEQPDLSRGPDPARRRELAAESVDALGHWLLSAATAAPGWDQLVADFVPAWGSPGAYAVRIAEVRGEDESMGATSVLGPETDVATLLETLRAADHEPKHGAWLRASIIIDAEGWPEPSYQVGADLEHLSLPEEWEGAPAPTAEQLGEDLRAYPREDAAVPGWMRRLLAPEPDALPGAEALRAAAGRGGAPTASVSAGLDERPDADQHHEPGQEPEEPVNPEVLQALRHYSRQPEHRTMLNVLRTVMGGELLLDVSGSELVPGPRGEEIGPGSTLRVQTVKGPDGADLLAVYARESTARSLFRASGRDVDFRLQRQSGVALLENFLRDQTCQGIVVEPNGEASCRLDRTVIQAAMNTPHLDAAKEALLAGSMPRLLGSLMAPSARLIVALDQDGPEARPMYIQPEGDGVPDTMLLFTSGPEVAAVDPDLTLRAAPALQALRLAVDSGARYVSLNALNPSAQLPIEQVRELLELAEAQQGQ